MLTEEEKKLICRGINSVWNEIAYDLLEGNYKKTIPKSEVIEVCLDADRLRDVQHRPHGVERDAWRELTARFYKLSIEEQNKIAEGFSQYKRFGL